MGHIPPDVINVGLATLRTVMMEEWLADRPGFGHVHEKSDIHPGLERAWAKVLVRTSSKALCLIMAWRGMARQRNQGETHDERQLLRGQGVALAQHLKLTDGKSGYVEVTATGFLVHIRRKWPAKQLTTWDGLTVEWNENVGSNKAANR